LREFVADLQIAPDATEDLDMREQCGYLHLTNGDVPQRDTLYQFFLMMVKFNNSKVYRILLYVKGRRIKRTEKLWESINLHPITHGINTVIRACLTDVRTGNFCFAQNRKFLLCVDKINLIIDIVLM
jgi:hypothetical protein